MPSEKRVCARIASGNIRPYKTARVGDEVRREETNTNEYSNDDMLDDMLLDEQSSAISVPTYQIVDTKCSTQHTTMRVAEALAWPTSLAAIRNQILYNITPQDGVKLPESVLRLVSQRILRPMYSEGVSDSLRILPYIHFGFIPFLNMQIFVFLPNFRINNPSDMEPGQVQEEILERWTNSIILPLLTKSDPRAPTSWRLAKLYSHSPAWYDDEVAPFPVYKMYDSQYSSSFFNIWERVLERSMKTPEFRHPFLLLYSDGQCPQVFVGSRPEEAMLDFEEAWHKHVDMSYIPWPEENLRIDFDYGNAHDIRDLPMR